jgi:hypothetical protein
MAALMYLDGPEAIHIPVLGVVALRGVPVEVEDATIAADLASQGWVTPKPSKSRSKSHQSEED